MQKRQAILACLQYAPEDIITGGFERSGLI
jgi:hypothetical protein